MAASGAKLVLHQAALLNKLFVKLFNEALSRMSTADGLRELSEAEMRAAAEQLASDPELREIAEGLGALNRFGAPPSNE
jgi:hypothetical protein